MQNNDNDATICDMSGIQRALLRTFFLGGGGKGGLLYMPERKYDQEQSLQIFITWQAFSALKESGNVISWGNESDGGPQGQQCEFVEIL